MTCYFMSELYQLQASSPVTLRVHHTYSAVTGVMRYFMSELYKPQASSPVILRVHQTYSAVTGLMCYDPY